MNLLQVIEALSCIGALQPPSTSFSKPVIEFLTWNGNKASILSFLVHVDPTKKDPFFAGAIWAHKSHCFNLV
jgi:hypothetical protein